MIVLSCAMAAMAGLIILGSVVYLFAELAGGEMSSWSFIKTAALCMVISLMLAAGSDWAAGYGISRGCSDMVEAVK